MELSGAAIEAVLLAGVFFYLWVCGEAARRRSFYAIWSAAWLLLAIARAAHLENFAGGLCTGIFGGLLIAGACAARVWSSQWHGFAARVLQFALLLTFAAALANGIAGISTGALALPLDSLLGFAALASAREMETRRAEEMEAEMDGLQRESKRTVQLDALTGLRNQSALARRLEELAEFPGVVAVCDLDNFKDVNDRFGHLVGDETLGNIGKLLLASIRHEDEAFRWGGDEFVILFLNQLPEVAERRMSDLEARLHDFQVRGAGTLPISISWGTVDARGRSLRAAVDEADRRMYAAKRARANRSARGV